MIGWLSDNALLPAREYWDNQWVKTLIHPLAVAGVEPFATRLKAAPDEVIRIFEPSDINIVVAGGETQGAWKMIAGRYGEGRHRLRRRLALRARRTGFAGGEQERWTRSSNG